jgi:hypothetical protein
VQYNPHETADHDHMDNPRQPQPRMSRRTFESPSAFPLSLCPSSPDLDVTLNIIDEWYPGKTSELEEGAFCVFAVNAIETSRPETHMSSVPPLLCSQDITVSAELPDERYAMHVTETTPQANGTTSSTTFRSANEFDKEPMLDNQIFPRQGRRDRQSSPRHLDALPMPSKQKRLIHHWVTFTSRKLVLIDEPHNPCRTMMLPMALRGLHSQATTSNADVAIFHGLCASAAYNLYELTGRTNDQDRVLALYHDNEAVHHLRYNLERADEHRDQSFAMAIMACIAVEAVSGTTQRWRTHVSGGLAYLGKLASQGLEESALSPYRQHMVKMAILCGFPVPDHLKSDGLEFTFPYYGISRSFLQAHDHINELLDSVPAARTLEFDKELDSFELQLYTDFPSLSLHGPVSDRNCNTHGVVVHHTSKAFYYAGLVFFQRSMRLVSIAAVQDLVDLGVQELESIDRVGCGKLGCLMLWPVLVLGAECGTPDVQNRMQAWFKAQRRLGFRNLVVLEELVTTVWKARVDPSADVRDADWRQVIEKARFDVFRL